MISNIYVENPIMARKFKFVPTLCENHFAKVMKTQFVWLSDKGNNEGDVRTSSQEEEELEKISEINNFDRSRSEKVIIFGLIYFFQL